MSFSFQSLLFPPSLYDYVIQELKRDIVLVFNKIDLVPAPVLVAWKEYFQTQFPLLHIIYFTSLPSYNLREGCRKPGLKGIRKKGKMRMAAEGAITLLEVCQKICGDQGMIIETYLQLIRNSNFIKMFTFDI